MCTCKTWINGLSIRRVRIIYDAQDAQLPYKRIPKTNSNFKFIIHSYVLRMKEYERERRLMIRRERKAKKEKGEFLLNA